MRYTSERNEVSTLTVWKFSTPEGAGQALSKLEGLEAQELVHIYDAATVTWPTGKKKPKTHQMNSTTGIGALDGTFWGLLFGMIFMIPFIGALVGAATGALAGALTDVGIDDNFIKSVRSQVTEGTSALFVMTEGAVVDRVAAAFSDTDMELIASNETTVDEQKTRAIFEH